jgi:hypothetical protein
MAADLLSVCFEELSVEPVGFPWSRWGWRDLGTIMAQTPHVGRMALDFELS